MNLQEPLTLCLSVKQILLSAPKFENCHKSKYFGTSQRIVCGLLQIFTWEYSVFSIINFIKSIGKKHHFKNLQLKQLTIILEVISVSFKTNSFNRKIAFVSKTTRPNKLLALGCKNIILILSITLITHLNIRNVVVGWCHKLQNFQNIHKKSYLKGYYKF